MVPSRLFRRDASCRLYVFVRGLQAQFDLDEAVCFVCQYAHSANGERRIERLGPCALDVARWGACDACAVSGAVEVQVEDEFFELCIRTHQAMKEEADVRFLVDEIGSKIHFADQLELEVRDVQQQSFTFGVVHLVCSEKRVVLHRRRRMRGDGYVFEVG